MMPWTCTGFDRMTFTDIEDVLFHQRATGHIVEEKPEQDIVGVADFGFVTLRGPDGKVKDVVGLN